jgi:DNA-binding HxlR family transcriptional regulator
MSTDDFSLEFYRLEERRRDFHCSLGFAMTVIGSKWRAIILWNILQEARIRYGKLKREIPHISHKILSHELKCLELDHMIVRIPYPTVPPKVEYEATAKGESLRDILTALCLWGKRYMD